MMLMLAWMGRLRAPAARAARSDLYGAQLYGQVPWVQVSELSALLILNLGGNPGFQNATPPNTFDASLPSKLPQLSDFWINDAGIEGRMPDSWADWPLMRRLALHNNKLGGTLDDIPWARFKALQVRRPQCAVCVQSSPHSRIGNRRSAACLLASQCYAPPGLLCFCCPHCCTRHRR